MAIGVVIYSSALRSIIVWSLVAFVDAEITLRLSDAAVVYNQSFSLICFTALDRSSQYAAFYRSLSRNDTYSLVASISYRGSCQQSPSSSPNYTYSCDNNGKEITLTVPADNLNEHNTYWKCVNAGGPILDNNNIVSIFVNVPVSLVQLDQAGSIILRESESRTLTCTTSFCRPEAVISWWKNDVNITNMANSSTYDQNTTTGTISYTGNRLDNGHTILCKAWNGYGSQQTSQPIILDIRYSPAHPTIGTYSNGSVFSMIETTQYTLTCIVTGGNPLAYISWNCFGLSGLSITVNQSVISTITPTVNRTQDRQPCQCISTQEIQGNVTAFIVVRVLYPPSLTPFTSPVKVIEGHPLELMCKADGSPPPKLTWSPLGDDTLNQSRLWYRNITRSNNGTHTCTATNTMEPSTGNSVTQSDSEGLVIDVLYSPSLASFISPIKVIEGGPLEVDCKADGNPHPSLTWSPLGEDTVNQSRLYYHNISRDDHGNHTCTAINTMQPTTGGPVTRSDSKGMVIDVLFPPTITPFTSVSVIEGDSLEQECKADGNPPPKLSWSPRGDKMVNQSMLYYHNISRSNHGNHTCTAINTMEPTTGASVTQSDSNSLVVNVLFPPTITPFTSVNAIEGDSLEQECKADGNPPPKLSWSPRGDKMVNQSMLYYHNISRSNHGNHTCTATNIMVPTNGHQMTMSDSKVIFINVQYKTSISAFTAKDNNNLIMENGSLELSCQVDSNPYSDIFLYHEDKVQLEKEDTLKLNYTKTAGCLDAGKYTCHANNSIMNLTSVSSDLQIMVACHPRLDHRKNVSTVYYRGLNSSVTLEVFVIAYPEPTNSTWYHRENETDMWQRLTDQPPSSGGLFSSILIHLISTRDFGDYMVTMDNYLGNFSNRYSIIPESRPEVPKNLNVTESGPDFVTLEWTPGFDGGHPQHFIIEYATHPDGDWLKSVEIQDVGSPKQSFVLPGLQQRTTYQIRMYAENKNGPSEKTQTIKANTSGRAQASVFPVGAVAGGISGAVVTVALVILVFILMRRGGLRNKDKGDDCTRELQAKERPESGLVDNPVYDSSGPSTSSGLVGVEYAVVVKKIKVDDASNLYAQVDKKTNKKKGGEKGKHGKISRGDIYENSNLVGQSSKDKLYDISEAIKTENVSDDNVYENPGAASSIGSLVSKDGLHYAELMLDPPTVKNGKPFIRGQESRTEYAKISYGKRGELLPDSNNEQDKKNKGPAEEVDK